MSGNVQDTASVVHPSNDRLELTVAHQVLNTGVDEQPDTFINQGDHEQGSLPHSVSSEQEVPVDVHVAALELDVFGCSKG